MLHSGYINFFDVSRCGLYRITKNNSQGLDMAETFAELKKWVDGRSFDVTNPWDPKTHRNKTACYAHKIYAHPTNGDYLLVLWKGESDKQGPLYGISINPDGSVDKAIKQTQINNKKPTIWGRPCYYWVIPQINTVASIKFDNSRCDARMFQDWVSGCITYKVPLPQYKRVETETGLVRIEFPVDTASETADEQEYSPKHIYSFEMGLRNISTGSARLAELSKKVTHIIRREIVSITHTDRRQGWHRLFKRFDVPYVSADDQTKRRVELRVEARPTLEEIKEIIDQHSQDHDDKGWEDTGFVTDKSGQVVWAGTFRMTENISIDDNGDAILEAEDLYRKILENRDRYIAPIIKDNLAEKTGTK
ncbi:hypothetical protein [Pseudomonas laurylsulfatiphila]|uniref:hypothetical protein n=1 Tax=Pseudomonas laurylsulfatiphila TaxID=2011015 RepID=UPI00215EB4D6|nr:hypothetical protein [Pseudomonas laurylsulfatiphila]UVM03005.1 hypothetical protein LOY25_18360 [Pseudomonas laurylsulfatiphila]